MRALFALFLVAVAGVVGPSNAIAADASLGQQVADQCVVCHTVGKGDGNGIGPNLFGVIGRRAGSLPDFSYTEALKSSHLTWSIENLSKWVEGPQKMVPGTNMIFNGIPSQVDRDNLIAYLETLK